MSYALVDERAFQSLSELSVHRDLLTLQEASAVTSTRRESSTDYTSSPSSSLTKQCTSTERTISLYRLYSLSQALFHLLRFPEDVQETDLLAHLLAARLHSCDSPADILAVFQEQVQESRSVDDRLTKWLDPTVNVPYAFSATLGEGVFSPAKVIFAGAGVLLLSPSCTVLILGPQAAKDVRDSQGALVDVFERVENFFK
ncbi:hypothetical protein EDB84DRAFT_1435334 [Lactarius hengduanensis]|nr:hypothetical protein EDB84DRAFT_1435334 [Lactarius hengduanensis]